MQMGALAVYARSRVTHDCDSLSTSNCFSRLHRDRAKVSVQTVIVRPPPAVFDHDVFSIIRVAGHWVDVHDISICDGAYLIERFAVCVAMNRPNIDAFMKTGVKDAGY